ncbi:hypothetical protein [Streptomyces sp. NPDC057579]|uniref:hypothetical protein n=1 Tax=Streptomyces sp. NPDC057579 TaxID=3346172 RepID=UPI0036CFCA5E
MASFVLPHTPHDGGRHKISAVHGRFADRSACDPVVPDLDREAFPYALADLRRHGAAEDTAEGAATGGTGSAGDGSAAG